MRSESGNTHGKWEHTLRIKTYIGNKDIYKKWKHKQRHKRGVGLHTKLRYIRKRDIKLRGRRDIYRVGIYTKWGYTQKDNIKRIWKGNTRELETYIGSGDIHRKQKHI